VIKVDLRCGAAPRTPRPAGTSRKARSEVVPSEVDIARAVGRAHQRREATICAASRAHRRSGGCDQDDTASSGSRRRRRQPEEPTPGRAQDEARRPRCGIGRNQHAQTDDRAPLPVPGAVCATPCPTAADTPETTRQCPQPSLRTAAPGKRFQENHRLSTNSTVRPRVDPAGQSGGCSPCSRLTSTRRQGEGSCAGIGLERDRRASYGDPPHPGPSSAVDRDRGCR